MQRDTKKLSKYTKNFVNPIICLPLKIQSHLNFKSRASSFFPRNLNRVSRDNWPFPVENLRISTRIRRPNQPRAVSLLFFFTVIERRWAVGWSRLPISRTTSTVRSNFRDTYNWFPAAVEEARGWRRPGIKSRGKTTTWEVDGPRFPVSGYSCITRERKIVGCWKVSKAIFLSPSSNDQSTVLVSSSSRVLFL